MTIEPPSVAPQTPAPAAPPSPDRRSSLPSSRSFAQTNTLNFYGASNPQRTARTVERRLARLGSSAGALNDTV